MDNIEHGILPEELRGHDWLKEIPTPEDEEKVTSEFESWLDKLRNTRLAEKASRLWRMFQEGELSASDKALAIGALLYCVTPFDLMPDLIPIVGCLDDLAVVFAVMAYLDRDPRDKQPADEVATEIVLDTPTSVM